MVESRETVSAFLQELHHVMRSEEFEYQRDLDILLRKKTDPDNPGFTTAETLVELGYGNRDVYEELLSLTVRDYYETEIDISRPGAPMFYVFGKEIGAREVYIKVKIRDRAGGKIFCVSFHFARYPMAKPYW